MDVRIMPHRLSGIAAPPPSKSMAHRLLIAALLGSGESTVRGVELSQDIKATLRCVEALGGIWRQRSETAISVFGVGGQPFTGDLPHLDCGESGSTLRFMIPIALAVAGGGTFTGRGRLMERPQQPYIDLFWEKGISWSQRGDTLTVRGRLEPGEYRLAGNVSSQFFTGLLFALPLLGAPSTILSTTPLESASYLTMTMGVLDEARVPVRFSQEKRTFSVYPSPYRTFDTMVEADWSQAAFWYAALALGSKIRLRGLSSNSFQGDKIVARHAGALSVPGDVSIDLSDCPDLLPPLAVMAAVRSGTTVFKNAGRLRMKESDRLRTVAELLTALGGQAVELPDALIVHGVPQLTGGVVNGANDHRIVMAAAIAATRAAGPVVILGAEAVKKSYPDFWHHYERLGGETYVL